MGKVNFSGSKIRDLHVYYRLGLVVCVNFLHFLSKKTLNSGIEIISEIPKQCLIITKTLLLQSF